MTGKEIFDSVLQLGLLVATVGLIRTGVNQANMAAEQARAAFAQVEGNRRPFFRIKRGETRSGDRWQALLQNDGPGIAFGTSWRLLGSFGNFVSYIELGAIGVGSSVQMPFIALETRKTLEIEDITSEGILIEYQDAVEGRYWSIIAMAPEGFLITRTGKGYPPASN